MLQQAGQIAAVEPLAVGQRARQRVGGPRVHQTQRQRIDAGLARSGVNQALDQDGRLRPPRAAVDAHGGGVAQVRLRAGSAMPHLVRPGHDARGVARRHHGTVGKPVAEIEAEVCRQRLDAALRIKPDGPFGRRSAAVRGRLQVFAARGLPAQRAAELPCGCGQHQVLGADRGLATKGASHVGGDHLHGLQGQAQRLRQLGTRTAGRLRGQPGLEALRGRVPLHHGGARLERARGHARQLYLHARRGWALRHHAVAQAHRRHTIARHACIDRRSLCVSAVGHGRPLFDVGPHQIGGRLRLRTCLGHHQGQRRAHGQHPIEGDDSRGGQLQRRQQGIDLRCRQARKISGGEDGTHAGSVQRRGHVHAQHPAMGMRTAHEHRVQQARQLHVAHVAARAGQQALVLPAQPGA